METATFAAGCFWGVEAKFAALKGVLRTEVGYTGGTKPNPTYRQVCSLATGHAEAVRIEYDPDIIAYEELLEAFFALHDPTQVDRQGPDVGKQYRSAIFFHSPEQERLARETIRRLEEEHRFSRPIATQVVSAGEWWRAEEMHQKYFSKQGRPGCLW